MGEKKGITYDDSMLHGREHVLGHEDDADEDGDNAEGAVPVGQQMIRSCTQCTYIQ